ncbi:hypothetical protein BJX63DRAFT_432030 [Aspergillus granulosus]|uniref:Uncharacterized protein n=1 Tax=Aspergillus granulosus TaxID=176169 RepID=A0ABR4HE58_9EURO
MNPLIFLTILYGVIGLGAPTHDSSALSIRADSVTRAEAIIQQRIADKKAQIAAMGANHSVITTMEELRAAIPGKNIWVEIWEPSVVDDPTTLHERQSDPRCSYVQEHNSETFDSGFKWDLWSYNNIRKGQGESMPFGLRGLHMSFANAYIEDVGDVGSWNTVHGQCSLTIICDGCTIRPHGGSVGSYNTLTDSA